MVMFCNVKFYVYVTVVTCFMTMTVKSVSDDEFKVCFSTNLLISILSVSFGSEMPSRVLILTF